MRSIEAKLISTFGPKDGGSAQGEFNNPSGLATDGAGNLIVADTGNHRIQKLSPEGHVLWVVGGQTGDGQPKRGTAPHEFASPRAVCAGPDDHIFLCDTLNCRVKEYDPEGRLIMMFGAQGNDEGQFGGVGPEGIDVDEEGTIFVADSHTIRGGNHRVQVFDREGRFLSTYGSYGTLSNQFAGSVPIREYGLDFGPGIGPGPEGPVGLALRRNRVLRYFSYLRRNTAYCADPDNGRVLVLTPMAENRGIIGKGLLHRPRQVSVDGADNLYVTDVHAHAPVWSATNVDREHVWHVERNCSWLWAFSAAGELIARVGSRELHDLYEHEGAGLHWHGDGVAVDKSNDTLIYLQHHQIIAKLHVELGEVAIPRGGLPTASPSTAP